MKLPDLSALCLHAKSIDGKRGADERPEFEAQFDGQSAVAHQLEEWSPAPEVGELRREALQKSVEERERYLRRLVGMRRFPTSLWGNDLEGRIQRAEARLQRAKKALQALLDAEVAADVVAAWEAAARHASIQL